MRYPEVFAAVAPLASGGAGDLPLERIKDTPVWAFHSADDAGTPIESVRRTVEALVRAGGNVHLTEVDSAEHDCWSAAFDRYHLLEWLLAQRRGEPSLAPGQVPLAARLADWARGWQWWQVLLQVGIPALVVAAAWRAVRARRRRARATPSSGG